MTGARAEVKSAVAVEPPSFCRLPPRLGIGKVFRRRLQLDDYGCTLAFPEQQLLQPLCDSPHQAAQNISRSIGVYSDYTIERRVIRTDERRTRARASAQYQQFSGGYLRMAKPFAQPP